MLTANLYKKWKCRRQTPEISIRPSTIYHRWSSHSNSHWPWHGEQTQSLLFIQMKRGTHRMLSEVRKPLDTFSLECLAMEVEDSVHRPICTEHLLARKAMLMNRFPSLCLHISLSLHSEPDIWKGGSRTVAGRAALLPNGSVNQTNAPQVTFSSAQEHWLNLYTWILYCWPQNQITLTQHWWGNCYLHS